MGRYIRQPDSISCGPTAIINALKWGGIAVTLEDFPKIKFSCQTVNQEDPDNWELNGTHDHNFDRTLRYAGTPAFKVCRKKRPSFKSVREHILRGGAICLGYHWEEKGLEGDHFVFIDRIERGLWAVVNDHDTNNNAIRWRRDQTIRKWLKDLRNGCPVVWFLTRKPSSPA